jgi:hypothetical protein
MENALIINPIISIPEKIQPSRLYVIMPRRIKLEECNGGELENEF